MQFIEFCTGSETYMIVSVSMGCLSRDQLADWELRPTDATQHHKSIVLDITGQKKIKIQNLKYTSTECILLLHLYKVEKS